MVKVTSLLILVTKAFRFSFGVRAQPEMEISLKLVSNCDLLIENPAHRTFYENRDKTENRYTGV